MTDDTPIEDEGPTVVRMTMRRPAREGVKELRALLDLATDLLDAGYSVTLTGDLSVVARWELTERTMPEPVVVVQFPGDDHEGEPATCGRPL